MVVHDTSHKPFSFRIAAAERRFHLSAFGNIFQPYCFADLCTFPFHRLPSHREIALTDYKCQSVFRSAVPLGC